MKPKKLFGNFILSVLNTVLALVFPLITFPYVSRVLGSSKLGIVNFAQSYGYYFIHIANFGISSYAIREISKVRDNKETLEKKANEIYNLNFFFSLISWILYVIIAWCVPKLHENFIILLIYSLMVALNFLSIEWVLQSFDDYLFSTIRSSRVRIVSLIAVFILIKDESDYVLYMAISTISEMGARIATLRYSNKRYVYLRLEKNFLNFKDHFYSMFTLFSFRLVNGLSAQLDKLMIGFMMTYSDVGIYSAGVKIVLMLAPIVETVGIVLFPTINIAANKSKESYLKMVKLNYNLILLMGIPMAVGVFLTSPMIIKLFAGNEFYNAINVLRIMSLIIAICPIGDLLGSKTLLIYDKNKELLICSSIVAFTNILFNSIFIPIAGIYGAAIASVIGYIVAVISRLFFTKKIIKFKLVSKELFKYMAFTTPFCVIYIIFKEIIDNSISGLIVFVIFCIVCYGIELIIFKDKTFMLMLEKLVERK